MKIQDVKKDNKELRSKSISVRTYNSYCKFMKDNKISPSKVFNKTIEELMKEKK